MRKSIWKVKWRCTTHSFFFSFLFLLLFFCAIIDWLEMLLSVTVTIPCTRKESNKSLDKFSSFKVGGKPSLLEMPSTINVARSDTSRFVGDVAGYTLLMLWKKCIHMKCLSLKRNLVNIQLRNKSLNGALFEF